MKMTVPNINFNLPIIPSSGARCGSRALRLGTVLTSPHELSLFPCDASPLHPKARGQSSISSDHCRAPRHTHTHSVRPEPLMWLWVAPGALQHLLWQYTANSICSISVYHAYIITCRTAILLTLCILHLKRCIPHPRIFVWVCLGLFLAERRVSDATWQPGNLQQVSSGGFWRLKSRRW